MIPEIVDAPIAVHNKLPEAAALAVSGVLQEILAEPNYAVSAQAVILARLRKAERRELATERLVQASRGYVLPKQFEPATFKSHPIVGR